MRGRCLNHLTNGPSSSQTPLRSLPAPPKDRTALFAPPLRRKPAPLGFSPVWDGETLCWGCAAPSKPNNVPLVLQAACISLLCRSSPRAISTGQLHTLPHFHLRPINQVVFLGPYPLFQGERSHLRGSFTLRCFQRLSRPYLATQLCPWQNNWCTRGMSIPVLSY